MSGLSKLFRGRGHRLLLAGLAWVLLCVSTVSADEAEEQVLPEDVSTAITKGIAAVRQNLFTFRRMKNPGYCMASLLALLNAGVPPDDPQVAEGLKYVLEQAERDHGYTTPYLLGLANMLMAQVKNPANDALARRVTARLLNECKAGWTYDFSRTQFALLGLHAAVKMGIQIPQTTFAMTRQHFETSQNADGGWSYQRRGGGSYGSMSAAGVASLFICMEESVKSVSVCGSPPVSPEINAGLKWLDEHFTMRTNPQNGNNHYYYLYALERAGVLTGQKLIGGHDWYREGAAFLVKQQALDGQWRGNDTLATEFALLFLGKGRTPVVIQKLQYGAGWNTDPYDAKDLAELASRELRTSMSAQAIGPESTEADLSAAPVLYLQGHGSFRFSHTLRQAIKAYVDQGGFVLGSACCGSAEFDRSFRTQIKLIFPDSAFEVLPKNHDVYTLRHAITDPRAFMIEGINTGCRTPVLYAPRDLCCAWGGCRGCKDRPALAEQEAKNLGVNIIACALGFTALKDKLASAGGDPARAEAALKPDSMVIGQIFHDGDWCPDPASLGNLAKTLKQQFKMPNDVVQHRVVLGTDELPDCPVLYITGHRAFSFKPAQKEVLRKYLDRGGFLLSDPCCGKEEFDAAFRRLCAELYPERSLAAVPAEHVLFKEPYMLRKVEYKTAAKAQFPDLAGQPRLEAVSAPDGRVMILYSRFNFGCELQGHPCANCAGLSSADAYKLAVNALYCALAH